MALNLRDVEKIPSSILDKLKIPLFVVDKSSTVLYANPASVSTMGNAGPFETVGNTLVARNQADSANLHLAVANASTKGERETFLINDFASDRMQLVSVLPLNGDDAPERDALVVVPKYDSAEENFANALRQLFRLSPGEVAIAGALVNGTDAEHIAEFRGAKVTTVRTQIAAIMLKTRTRRQGELVALLSRVAGLP